jgi:hypothetical protein
MINLSAPQTEIEKTSKIGSIADRLGVFPPIEDVEHVSEAHSAGSSRITVAFQLHSLNLQPPGNKPNSSGQLDQRPQGS